MNNFNEIKSNIVGVFGYPLQHSLSPFMHNNAFQLANLNFIYTSFEVPVINLKSAVVGVKALGIKGFNVTIPYKEKIIDFIDNLSEESSIIGAVNTVVNENGILHGYNTDTNGIFETLFPLKEYIDNSEVTIIGSGGSARSAIFTLIRKFKINKINIINRSKDRAATLADYFSAKMNYNSFKIYELFPPEIINPIRDSALVINATPVGLYPEIEDSPTEIVNSFHKEQIVFDFVYNPLQTKFLQIAEENGAKTINGLKMFVEQGAKSFELWTNQTMPKAKIYQLIEEKLKTDLGKVD
jgi:shikimate dehydrogenase